MSKVDVYYARSNKRSKLVAEAMFEGIRKCGGEVTLKTSAQYRGRPVAKTSIFYGLGEGLRALFDDCRKSEKFNAVYIDLGYFGRRKRSRYDGYHKFALNSRHPTAYFNEKRRDRGRFDAFDLEIQPWRKSGAHIIVAGMSAKAALTEGFQPHQWERDTIAQLRNLTRREIVYRPKPNWLGSKPIVGSRFDKESSIPELLHNCHAVVTHHSNVAIEALIAGVPCICPDGVASLLSSHKLSDIENPIMPAGRRKLLENLAWTQFSIDEMRSGFAWSTLKKEGLV